MTHDHDLPKNFEDVRECATELYSIITGQTDASYIVIATHAYRLLGYLLYVLGADEENVIGTTGQAEMALQLTTAELKAIDDCMLACGHKGPVVGGPLSAWALRVIIMAAAKMLIELLADLIDGKDGEKAIAELGDGSLLRILLESLPLILSAIEKLLDILNRD